MKGLISSIFVICMGVSLNCIACSCVYYITNFCESVNESHSISTVRVISNDGNYMPVVIIESLFNQLDLDTLVFINTDMYPCGNGLPSFNTNDTLIIAHLDYDTLGFGGSCTRTFLKLSQNQVTGEVTPDIYAQNYQEFKANLKECVLMQRLENITIYPNPTSGEINLSNAYGEINVYNFLGQKVWTNSNREISRVDISNLENGYYLMKMTTDEYELTEQIILMK